jgi:uncharacterized caspase-like protein
MRRLGFAIWLALLPGVVAAEERIALVIGNSAYSNNPLVNPVNDAKLMAGALRAQGFEVIERLDVGQTDMKLAIVDFGAKLDAASGQAVGLFYYAGHGVQVNGHNYLIPVDAPIENESHVGVFAVSAEEVLEVVAYGRARINLIVLDACRNNPFARSFRAATRGLATMSAPTGTLIAYSTAPGQTALDGDGVNSPYTAALASAIAEPGVPLEKIFKNVRDTVLVATQGRQTPWEASSLTGADYYLAGAGNADTVAEAPVADAGDSAMELALWNAIAESDDPRQFQAYLDQFPEGIFATFARLRLEDLAETEVAAAVAPLEPVFEVEPYAAQLVATRNSNLRAGPSTEHDKTGNLGAGDPVTVTGKVQGRDWYRVALADGGEAYVWAPLLGERPPPEPAVAAVAPVPEATPPPEQVAPPPGNRTLIGRWEARLILTSTSSTWECRNLYGKPALIELTYDGETIHGTIKGNQAVEWIISGEIGGAAGGGRYQGDVRVVATTGYTTYLNLRFDLGERKGRWIDSKMFCRGNVKLTKVRNR